MNTDEARQVAEEWASRHANDVADYALPDMQPGMFSILKAMRAAWEGNMIRGRYVEAYNVLAAGSSMRQIPTDLTAKSVLINALRQAQPATAEKLGLDEIVSDGSPSVEVNIEGKRFRISCVEI